MSIQNSQVEMNATTIPARRVEDTLRELAYVMHLTRKVKQEILTSAPVSVRRKARKNGRIAEAA